VIATRHEAAWHDAECGGYAVDLPIWAELAREAGGPVLELGCGTGRVALHLARAGIEVTAVDTSPALLAALTERAAGLGVEIECVLDDARELDLGRRFGLIAAPMQVAQLMGGPSGRRLMFDRAAGHLAPGGALAVAVLAEPDPPPPGGSSLLPDVLERDGYTYSSLPVDVRMDDEVIEIKRLRQLVSPAGDLTDEPVTIRLERLPPARAEAEAESAGLVPRERIEVPPTSDHVGSTIVVLEAR
jgi:SAM-dependent methyltransferase